MLVRTPPIGERRPGRRRPEPDPAEGALARGRQRDVAHRGPVLALVVAHLDLAPAAVPHRFPRCSWLRSRPPAGRDPDPALHERRNGTRTRRLVPAPELGRGRSAYGTSGDGVP